MMYFNGTFLRHDSVLIGNANFNASLCEFVRVCASASEFTLLQMRSAANSQMLKKCELVLSLVILQPYIPRLHEIQISRHDESPVIIASYDELVNIIDVSSFHHDLNPSAINPSFPLLFHESPEHSSKSFHSIFEPEPCHPIKLKCKANNKHDILEKLLQFKAKNQKKKASQVRIKKTILNNVKLLHKTSKINVVNS